MTRLVEVRFYSTEFSSRRDLKQEASSVFLQVGFGAALRSRDVLGCCCKCNFQDPPQQANSQDNAIVGVRGQDSRAWPQVASLIQDREMRAQIREKATSEVQGKEMKLLPFRQQAALKKARMPFGGDALRLQ